MKALTIALILCASTAMADHCHVQRFVRHGNYSYGHHQFQKVVVVHAVAQEIRDNALIVKAADEAAAKVTAILEAKHADQMAALKQQFTAALSGKVCVEFNTGSTAGTTGNGNSSPPPTGQPVPASGDAAAQEVINRNGCVRCHQGPGSQGGDADFRDLSKLPELAKRKIEFVTRKGIMPPKGQGEPINDADATALENWIQSLPK